MTICDRFRTVRLHFGLSQSEMSTKVGLSKNAWQTYELGRSTPGTQVYSALISLGISIDWLLSDLGSMFFNDPSCLPGHIFLPSECPHKLIPDDHGCAINSHTIAFAPDWIVHGLGFEASELVMITVKGDSMMPAICPGDLLIVNHTCNRIFGDGIYVVLLSDGCIVKRVQTVLNGVRILSDNPAYAEIFIPNSDLNQLKVAGRVIWHGGRT